MSEEETKSELEQQLEAEVEAHNQVHNQITQGEEQLAQLRVERDRRYGRITVLSELVQSEKEAAGDVPTEEELVEED